MRSSQERLRCAPSSPPQPFSPPAFPTRLGFRDDALSYSCVFDSIASAAFSHTHTKLVFLFTSCLPAYVLLLFACLFVISTLSFFCVSLVAHEHRRFFWLLYKAFLHLTHLLPATALCSVMFT
ncbi:hypothetical protein KP509_03G097400 [Ceratopteris richardii]|uniref:Transmembrane protein n=1 Tax=Ceratopteris richardii TaxID=49495 RepID=A0A8T2V9N4_CERRI|nr:hypothetical protein KP509_03G097300 [Ceratopteris richardii]KAH7442645.1 hypothetical protein KP509_03G097400 [Ceratopteris richardii]